MRLRTLSYRVFIEGYNVRLAPFIHHEPIEVGSESGYPIAVAWLDIDEVDLWPILRLKWFREVESIWLTTDRVERACRRCLLIRLCQLEAVDRWTRSGGWREYAQDLISTAVTSELNRLSLETTIPLNVIATGDDVGSSDG